MLGLLAFFVALLVLVLVHEYGHFAAARLFGVAVEEFGFGFPPRAWGKRIGDTLYSINWLPLGGFVRIKGEEEAVKDLDSFSAQPAWRRATIVVAGVVMNLVLAIVLLTVGYSVGLTEALDTSPDPTAAVSNVEHRVVGILPQSPASTVFEQGDRIVSLDGEVINSRADFQAYVRSHPQESIRIDFLRGDQSLSAVLAPTSLGNDGDGVFGFGVELVSVGTVAYPLYRAPVVATTTVFKTFGLIGTTLWSMVVDLWRGTSQGLSVAGPIGIAVLSGEVANLGIMAYVQFLALLSINLAFVNILPFPALDGGRLLFIIIEGIRRRPISRDVEAKIHRLGFTILIGLVLLVTVVDIRNFGPSFSGWLQQFANLF